MVNHKQDEILDIVEEEDVSIGVKVDNNEIKQLALGESLLNVVHVNIRSINKNIDNLITFIESYKLQCIDIFVLSETFQLVSTSNCNIPNYQLFYNEASYNKNDGVIVLVKDGINVNFRHEKLNISGATVGRLEFQLNNILFGLTAVYKPPPISKVDFISDLQIFLEGLMVTNIEILIGDINIDILDRKDNNANDYLALMNSLGFQSYINSVTRELSGSCLDHVFVKQKLKSNNIKLNSYIFNEDITDHSPVMLLVRQKKIVQENCNSTVRRSKLNMTKFKEQLQGFDWSVVLNESNPELATKIFIDSYTKLLDNSTETYVLNMKSHRKIKNWITNGIITSIKIRDKMKKKIIIQT